MPIGNITDRACRGFLEDQGHPVDPDAPTDHLYRTAVDEQDVTIMKSWTHPVVPEPSDSMLAPFEAAAALAETMSRLVTRFRSENVRRLAEVEPSWNEEIWIDRLASIANLLDMTNLNQDQTVALAIHQFRNASITKLGALAQADLDQVVPENDEPFAAVDPMFGTWPEPGS